MTTDRITDTLDLLAVLLIGGALVGGLWPQWGWWSLIPCAATFIVGSQIIARFQGN